MLFASAVTAQQPMWSSVSAFERDGVYHASIRGRLIDSAGQPVPSVRVLLASGSAFLDQTFSDSGGRFSFSDIVSPDTVRIVVDAPERLVSLQMAAATMNGAGSDLGDIRLETRTLIRASIESVGAVLPDPFRLSVFLVDRSAPANRVYARRDGEEYILDEISFRQGMLTVEINDKERETYSAPIEVEVGRIDRAIKIRLRRDPKLKTLEYSETLRRADDTPRMSVSGRLLDSANRPIPGAMVRLEKDRGDWSSLSFTRTGPDGDFNLEVPGPCREADKWSISATWLFEDRLRPILECGPRGLGQTPFILRAGGTASVELSAVVQGGRPLQAQFKWWHPRLGWEEIRTDRISLVTSNFNSSLKLQASAPGYIPVIHSPELLNETGPGAGPAKVERFVFDESTVRRLEVVQASGKPVANAIVDLEWTQDLIRRRRMFVASYRTSSEGVLELKGERDRFFEAFVYADGFAPARVTFQPGTTRVNLKPQNGTIEVTGLKSDQFVRIKTTEGTTIAILTGVPGSSPKAAVAAGQYYVALIGRNGALENCVPVDVSENGATPVTFDRDLRPRVRVRFPDATGGWSAGVVSFMPPTIPTGASSFSFRGGVTLGFPDPVSVLESRTNSEWVFRVAGPGHYVVVADTGGIEFQLSRDIDVVGNDDLRVDLPKLSAVLRGSMKTYNAGKDRSAIHGWAGPRLMLLPDDKAGWAISMGLPDRIVGDVFEIRYLPAGRYHVFQHLIGERKGIENQPRNAWGGIPVELTAAKRAVLKDFSDYKYSTLKLKIFDADSRPVDGATLYVRDRMWESWVLVEGGATTLSFAGDPIPAPPGVRIADGVAEVPSIRRGRLEMMIVKDDGQALSFERQVDPSFVNEIRLDSKTR